jgi:hypothetical protein
MALAIAQRRITGSCHRLVPARHPPVGVFDRVASAADLEATLELEALSDDQAKARLGILRLLPREDWMVGEPGATLVMAAFCHPSPVGARFTDSRLGGYYAALDLETAVAETVHHNTRRLLETGTLHVRMVMRHILAAIDASLHDICGLQDQAPNLYHTEDYRASQAFGARLRGDGANGIAYHSVRRAAGTCIVVFRPRLVLNAADAGHFAYHWAGQPEPEVRPLPRPA